MIRDPESGRLKLVLGHEDPPQKIGWGTLEVSEMALMRAASHMGKTLLPGEFHTTKRRVRCLHLRYGFQNQSSSLRLVEAIKSSLISSLTEHHKNENS